MVVFLLSSVFFALACVSSGSANPCNANETYVTCRQVCPPQSCDISYTETFCDSPSKCEPGCNCVDNYLRDANGICIKNDDCPPPTPACGENEVHSDCKQFCPPPTCDYDPTKYACRPGPCQPGCNCIEGYLRNSDGICIPKDSCPVVYETEDDELKIADSEENTSNSRSCISTTLNDSTPTSSSINTATNENGTVEGDNKCRQNETYVFCNAGCPTNYCPVDDSRGIIACSPPYPCPAGCACRGNYKRLSVHYTRCILASECPPVNCTRPNEVWYACPPPCFSDSCRRIGVQVECHRSGPDCQPQCACEEGFYRNDMGDCVLQEHCD